MANKTLSFFEQIFQTIGGILIAFIRQIAPFAVPAAPAFFLAHAVGSAADSLEPGLGIYVGIVAALGLESAGILGAHYAVSMYTKNDPRYPVAIGATVAYLIIGIATIWLLDTDTNGRIVGTAMFLIAAIVYLLVGMAESDRQTAVVHQSATDHQHHMDVLDRQLKHEEKLARIQAKQAAQTATSARQDTRQDTAQRATNNGNLPDDWRQLTFDQKAKLATMSREERETYMPHLADRTRRAWHERLDKIAANGHKNGHMG